MKKIFFIIIFCYLECFSNGEINFKISKISNTPITHATIDKNGFTWYLSNNELYFFDGNNTCNLKIDILEKYNPKKIKKNGNYLLFYDSFHGLHSYNIDLRKSETLIKNSHIIDVVYYNSNNFYALSNNGELFIKKDKSLKVIKIKTKKNLTLNSRLCIFENRIFISIQFLGLFEYVNGRLKKLTLIKPEFYSCSFKISNNNLFLINNSYIDHKYIHNNNLFFLNNKLLLNISENKIINDFFYFYNKKVTYELNGNIYLDNEVIFQIDNLKNKYDNNTLIQNGNSLYVFNKSGISIITFYKNKNYIKNIKDEKFKDIRIRRKILISNDSLILFGHPYNLIKTQNKESHIKIKEHSCYDAIKIKNKYYIATEDSGLITTDFKTEESFFYNENDKSIISLFYNKKNNELYFAGYKYIYKYNFWNKKIYKYNNPLKGYAVKDFLQLNENELIIGTDSGVFILNPKNGKSKLLKSLNGFSIGNIILSNNNIYIGHDKGIDIFDKNLIKKKQRIKLNSLKDPKVCSVYAIDTSKILISTFSGLVLYNIKNKKSLILTKDDGLINEEFNYKSSAKLSKSKIIFGGINGYDIIDLSKIKQSNNISNNLISGYEIYDTKKNVVNFNLFNKKTEPIIYNRDYQYIKLLYSTNDFLNNFTYKYSINNVKINNSNNHYLSLIGLKEGEYDITIEAISNSTEKVYNDKIKIIVKDKFYKTFHFFITICILIISLSIFIVYLVINAKKRQKLIFQKISMDLHDELGSYLYKAKLLINNNANKNKELIEKNINNAVFSLRLLINNLDSKKIIFNKFEYEINEIFTEIFIKKEETIEISFKVFEEIYIKYELYRDLKFIFYEISNNYIKHGKENKLKINIEYNSGLLTFNIRQLNKNPIEKFNKLGNGLKNIEERLKRWNSINEIFIDSEFYEINFKIKI